MIERRGVFAVGQRFEPTGRKSLVQLSRSRAKHLAPFTSDFTLALLFGRDTRGKKDAALHIHRQDTEVEKEVKQAVSDPSLTCRRAPKREPSARPAPIAPRSASRQVEWKSETHLELLTIFGHLDATLLISTSTRVSRDGRSGIVGLGVEVEGSASADCRRERSAKCSEREDELRTTIGVCRVERSVDNRKKSEATHNRRA